MNDEKLLLEFRLDPNKEQGQMEEELISVIIPIYNTSGFLRSCVQSVENQTYNNLQIILVDDGSTDDSLLICKELESLDERIQYIHQDNQGSGAARNLGIKYARGKYIAFVDSDDLIDRYFIMTLKKNIEEYNAIMSIVGLKYVEMDYVLRVGFDKEGKRNIYLPKELISFLYETKIHCSVDNKLYLKEIIDRKKLSFQEQLKFWEDLDFNIRYLVGEKETIIEMEDPYYFVRERNNSQTRTGDIKKNSELLQSTKYIFITAKQEARLDKDNISKAANLYARVLIEFYFHGGKLEGMTRNETAKEIVFETNDISSMLLPKEKQYIKLIGKMPKVAFVIGLLIHIKERINHLIRNRAKKTIRSIKDLLKTMQSER